MLYRNLTELCPNCCWKRVSHSRLKLLVSSGIIQFVSVFIDPLAYIILTMIKRDVLLRSEIRTIYSS